MRGHVAKTLTFVRTAGGTVRVDEGDAVPADALPEEILRLAKAGAIEEGEVPDPEPEPDPVVVDDPAPDSDPALAEPEDGTPAGERVDDAAPAVADTAAGARTSGRRRPGKAQEG